MDSTQSTAPTEPGHLDTSRKHASPIEICAHDLSYSIVPKPSAVATGIHHLSRKAAQTSNWAKQKLHLQTPNGKQADSSVKLDATKVGTNILRHVNMTVKPGQVCLLLGSSGAGKTSLLNALSGRFDAGRTALSGAIQFNGEKAEKYWKTGAVGYLDQDEHLQPYLTPRETLEFVAKMHKATLRLTPQIKKSIEDLLLCLGLRDCADRRIGHASDSEGNNGGGSATNDGGGGQQGLSGGEKRRVSVAIQLLTDPSVLFCDEPTSGLDAFSSFEMMKTLTTLAKETGKTIVVSIHQPRSEIFQLLAENDGQLVLLSLGDVVYSGPVADSLDWFTAAVGDPFTSDMNAFDYMLDLSAVDYSSERLEAATRKRRQHLVDAWAKRVQIKSPPTQRRVDGLDADNTSIQEDATGTADSLDSKKGTCKWQQGFKTAPSALSKAVVHSVLLSKRALQAQIRDTAWFVSYIVIHVIVGVWMAYIFYDINTVSLAMRARVALSLALAAFQPFLSMTVMVYRGTGEIRVFDRERKDGWYGPVPFLVSAMIKNAPLACIGTLVYSTIVYYVAELRTDSIYYYIVSMLTLFAIQITQCSYVLVFIAIARGFAASSLIAFAVFVVYLLSAGFYIPYYLIPSYYKWTHYASYLALGFKILLSTEFTDREFECPFTDEGVRNPVRCEAYDGNFIIKQFYSYPHYYPWTIALFLIHIVGYLALSWGILTLKVVEPSAPSTPGSVIDLVMDVFISPFYSSDSVAKPKPKQPESGKSGDDEKGKAPAISSQEEKATACESLSLSSLDTGGSGKTAGLQMSEEDSSTQGGDVTRIEMYNDQLEVREPVKIRLDNVCLYAHTTTWRMERKAAVAAAPWLKRHKTTKPLLQGISGDFSPGELTAILGGSGAGKTSLLNVMLRRSAPNLTPSGEVWFNSNKNPSLRRVNGVCGFVPQDDSFLMSHLTVRETLRYVAELNRAGSATRAEKWAKVESIMELMGLLECADVLVGSDDAKGCSGGQRRRVSIALQLVLEPPCLVLDEPTTGLDAMTALALVRTLKGVARTGRTVVCSIHQPRHDIWNEFDNVLLLMTEGRLGFMGKRADALPFFAQAGHVLPEHTNPADFIIDVVSINFQSPEAEAATRQQVDSLAKAFVEYCRQQGSTQNNSEIDPPSPSQVTASKLQCRPAYFATFRHAFPILTRRSFQNVVRQKSLFFNRLSLSLVIAILSSLFYKIEDNGPMSLLVRGGFIQQMMLITYSGLLSSVCIFPLERDAAFHDISNGMYGCTSFLASYMANELPMTLLGAGIMTVVCRAITFLQWTPMETAVFFFVSVAYMTTGESLAIISSSWTKNNGITVNASIGFVLLYSLMAGVVNPHLTPALEHLSYLSLWKYSTIALTLLEGQGLQVECSQEMIEKSLCPFRTGEQAIRYIRYHTFELNECLVAIAGLTVFYRFIAWVSLMARVKKQRWQ